MSPSPDTPCVQLRDVHLTVDGDRYLRGLDLDVARGESVVIAAPPGSGKSFVPRLLLGMPGMDADQVQLRGEVRVEGHSLAEMTAMELQRLRRRVGNIMRDGGLIENMDIFTNVCLPLTYHYRELLDEGQIAERGVRVLRELGMEHLAAAGLRPVALHREERIYASLARALVCEPFLLLTDEPCTGLSPGPSVRLCERLFGYEPRFASPLPDGGHGGLGLTRIATTANLGPYVDFADRFLLLADGRLEEIGGPDRVRATADERVLALLESREPAAAGATA